MISFSRIKPRAASPDITPLLDVVFILLIFFVVSTVFATRGMNMDLPAADSSRPVCGTTLDIELRDDGSLLCDTAPISFDALSNRLRVIAERPLAKQPQNILLRASPRAEVEGFVRIVDMVRTYGFENLVIVTRTSGHGPSGDGG